jgi:hypothetical protein
MAVRVSIFVSSFNRENITIFDPLISSFIDRKLAIDTNKSLTRARRAAALTFPSTYIKVGRYRPLLAMPRYSCEL